jgi:hypothetical protein
MKLSRVPAALGVVAAAFVVACDAGGVGTAAKAGSQELSVDRLGDIIASSQAPLEVEVARSVAELWVNYQLAGMAAARGDTVTANDEMDAGLWSAIDNMRVKVLYDSVSKTWAVGSDKSNEQRFADGEFMSARHILVTVGQDAPADAVEAARKKAEGIRAEATPANFVRLAARSDEPGAGDRGGDLGVFTPGTMVPEFETAVLAINPGEISPVIRTSFGFHVIYRKPFAEVAEEVSQQAQQRNMFVAESTYLASMENGAQVKLSANAVTLTKDAARNPLGLSKNTASVADYVGGKLTAGRLADWIAAYPPQSQIRPQLMSAPDSIAEQFVRQIVRNELLLMKADSAKLTVNADELGNLRLAFRNNLTSAWTTMGVEPTTLSDSAKTPGERETLAGNRIESYFDKLVKNEVQFADVAYPVARSLQNKYSFTINDAGLERAVEKARQIRAAADSTGGAAGGAAAPAGAPPAEPPMTPPPTP